MTAMNSHCWLQVSSGQGPDECALAVKYISQRIILEAEQYGLHARYIDCVPGSKPGTLISALLGLQGDRLDDFIKRWYGTVQWVCSSPYRPEHKRKNWFVGVETLSAVAKDQCGINIKDVDFDTIRASGPGGQHVNTTDSAVRATHRPSGTTVVAREERSQHMNKRLALARLQKRLEEKQKATLSSEKQFLWEQHNQLERGNPVRVFEGEIMVERKVK